jgi:hypothetical protein
MRFASPDIAPARNCGGVIETKCEEVRKVEASPFKTGKLAFAYNSPYEPPPARLNLPITEFPAIVAKALAI